MFSVGDHVRVLAPFAESFPETYRVTEVVTYENGNAAHIVGETVIALPGGGFEYVAADHGAFDAIYLELAV